MAKIGLLKPKYAPITANTDSSGVETETYGELKTFAKAVSATTSINTAKAKLYADDDVAEMINEFVSGQLTFAADDVEDSVNADVTGATVSGEDQSITHKDTDTAPYLRFGFLVRGFKNNQTRYKAICFPKIKFDIPADDYETKGETINFRTTTLTAEILRNIRHEWKIEGKWEETEAAAETTLNALVKPTVAS